MLYLIGQTMCFVEAYYQERFFPAYATGVKEFIQCLASLCYTLIACLLVPFLVNVTASG